MHPHAEYLLHLADNALVLSHRNSEWCGHGPELEQDIALSNIALDLLGQARHLYRHATTTLGGTNTEDSLAYLRDTRAYRNILLVELPRGDWGFTILRQYLFSEFSHLQYTALQHTADTQLAAIAAKALVEVAYHRRWSGEWVVRLGDGTDESHRRMATALDSLWPYTGEMFDAAPYEQTATAQDSGIDPATLRADWLRQVEQTLREATLADDSSTLARAQTPHHKGGKQGLHTEHLGYLLAEMQFLQRAYPGNEW
jgi:ring-1,2-phenylacetyl-CoA epoxidase subunit PaaC